MLYLDATCSCLAIFSLSISQHFFLSLTVFSHSCLFIFRKYSIGFKVSFILAAKQNVVELTSIDIYCYCCTTDCCRTQKLRIIDPVVRKFFYSSRILSIMLFKSDNHVHRWVPFKTFFEFFYLFTEEQKKILQNTKNNKKNQNNPRKDWKINERFIYTFSI